MEGSSDGLKLGLSVGDAEGFSLGYVDGAGLGAGLSVGEFELILVGSYVPEGAGLGASEGCGLGAGESVGADVTTGLVLTGLVDGRVLTGLAVVEVDDPALTGPLVEVDVRVVVLTVVALVEDGARAVVLTGLTLIEVERVVGECVEYPATETAGHTRTATT